MKHPPLTLATSSQNEIRVYDLSSQLGTHPYHILMSWFQLNAVSTCLTQPKGSTHVNIGDEFAS